MQKMESIRRIRSVFSCVAQLCAPGGLNGVGQWHHDAPVKTAKASAT
jgi:hypothetical protein